jgi:putative endonuclease
MTEKIDWYLYLIRCRDGSLYAGISTDVERRFAQHQKPGQGGSKYLQGRGPLVLVFQAMVGDYSLALKVEYKVKKLSKDRKLHLINNPQYLDETVIKARQNLKLKV